MPFLKEFQNREKELKEKKKVNDDDVLRLYLQTIAGTLAAIADEQHEANRLKRLEIEHMKKRRD